MELLRNIAIFLAYIWAFCILVGWILSLIMYNITHKQQRIEKNKILLFTVPRPRAWIYAPRFCFDAVWIVGSYIVLCIVEYLHRLFNNE